MCKDISFSKLDQCTKGCKQYTIKDDVLQVISCLHVRARSSRRSSRCRKRIDNQSERMEAARVAAAAAARVQKYRQ
jgi:hypothetical protein